MLFVAYLVNEKRQSSTIKSYISAIKNVLHDDGVVLNQDTFLLNALTKACKLKNDSSPSAESMAGVHGVI